MIDSFDFVEVLNSKINKSQRDKIVRVATVTEIGDKGLKIKVDGEDEPRYKFYKKLAQYSGATVGDRILIFRVEGIYVVIGKIV